MFSATVAAEKKTKQTIHYYILVSESFKSVRYLHNVLEQRKAVMDLVFKCTYRRYK